MILAGVLAVVLLGDAVIRGGWAQTLLLAPWILLFVWAAYVIWYAPSVTVDDDAISVHNYLRRAHVPWGRIAEVSARWQLLLRLDDGSTVRAIAVTARRGRGSTAGDDVDLIQERWEASTATGGDVERSWDLPVVGALVVLVAWAVLAVVIANSSG